MFKQLKGLVLLGALVFVLSGAPAAAAAAAGTPPDGSYCGSDNAGNAFKADVLGPVVNVTVVSGTMGSTCQVYLQQQVINGNYFSYPSPSSYSFCMVVRNLAVAGFKDGNVILSYSASMGDGVVTVTASPCAPPASGAYCGRNDRGHVVVLRVGSPLGSSFYPTPGLTTIGLAYRSNTSDKPRWSFDFAWGGSALFTSGNVSTTISYPLWIKAVSRGGFSVSLGSPYGSEQVTVQVTKSGCQAASGTYLGTSGALRVLIATAENGNAVLALPPVGPITTSSDSMYQTPASTVGPAPYFVVGGSLYLAVDSNMYSSSPSMPLNVTSLTFAANTFTLSYFNKTAKSLKLSQVKSTTFANSTFCGTAGSRSVFLAVGTAPIGQRMSLTEVSDGAAVCSSSFNALVLSTGATLITGVEGNCLYSGLSITYAASTGFTVSSGASKLTLASCTANQPAGRYCGGTSKNVIVLDTNAQTLQVFSQTWSYPSCSASGPARFYAMGSSGAVVNTTSYFSCDMPLQVVSFKSGAFSVTLNGTSVSLTKAGCMDKPSLSGTFCGASSSVYATLEMAPGYYADLPFLLVLGSTTTGFAESYNGQLNPYLATTTSLLLTLNSRSSMDATFAVASLVPGANKTTVTLRGRHSVLGAVAITLSVSNCAAAKNDKSAYCGIKGSQEVFVSDGSVYVAWLNSSSSLLAVCEASKYTQIAGKYYLAKPRDACSISPPVNVTGITSGNGKLTASLKAGAAASTLDLTAATCPKSIAPTSRYCGSLGGKVVVASMDDLSSAGLVFGSCVYGVEVQGVTSTGKLIYTVTSTGDTCETVKTMTWSAATASLTVSFSTSGSVTLKECGADIAPDGEYCGVVGDALVKLQYMSGRAFFTWSKSDPSSSPCYVPLYAVYNKGKYVIVKTPTCLPGTTSIIPAAMSFASGAFTVTIGNATGTLQQNACQFPLTSFCGVDAKAKKQVMLSAVPSMYGSMMFYLRIGNATGGPMQALSLYPMWAVASGLVVNIDGKNVLLTVRSTGVINLALKNVYFGGMVTMDIAATLNKNSC